MRILSKLILRPVQLVLEVALLVALVALLVVFGLQFVNLPGITNLSIVLAIKRMADPLIAEVGSWVGMQWPGGAAKFLPLGMAAAVWGLRVILLDGLRSWIHSIEIGRAHV